MTQPLAELDDVRARLDADLDEVTEPLAASALAEASDLAREYGRDWVDADRCPRLVRGLVARATARFVRNPDGYARSRSGDESVEWAEGAAGDGGVFYTEPEIRLIRSLAGRSDIHSVEVIAWGTRQTDRTGYIPVEDGKPFPYFADESEPW
ncbi:hypothetical protein [Salininema proteolyticum]|uniref:Head-to-tail adaptor n=1 Tax=Salininema proteolyticum TaxID=1607685 RepID=A0ABV8TUI2_9ACTN